MSTLKAQVAANDMIRDILDPDFTITFNSDYELDNIQAMSEFIADYDLEDFVVEDDGTLVSFNFGNQLVHLSSYGGGDFYTHVIERVND